MSILVGVPTHRRPELLRQCLESIAAQAGELPPVRVFVADNDANGQEGARLAGEMAAAGYRFPISSIVVAEPGISAVRNAILAEARRGFDDFIAMIDDDETASSQWLAELLKTQAKYRADVVGGPVARKLPETVPGWMQADFFPNRRFSSGPIDVIDASGNLLISRDTLERAGWPEFDCEFGLTGGEDTAFLFRLRKMGFSFVWASQAEASELVPPERCTLSWFIRRNFRIGNAADRLHRGSLMESRRGWAVKTGLLSPLLLILAIQPSSRLRAFRRLAYAGGVLSSALGYRYLEYAERHDRA